MGIFFAWTTKKVNWKTLGLFFFAFYSSIASAAEKTLLMNFQIRCSELRDGAFPGIHGTVQVQGRNLRFNLFKYVENAEVSLGDLPVDVQLSDLGLQLGASDDCQLSFFHADIKIEENTSSIENLAFRHSPFLVIRQDQQELDERDVPVGVSYSVVRDADTIEIIYTLFFSNETVHWPWGMTKKKSLAVYGRRTDIEWIYRIKLDKKGLTRSEKYQSGVIRGMGHATRDFDGDYLPGTDHPVLFNIAKHNVFSDHPTHRQKRSPLIGFHLVPREEISSPFAREWWMWKHPWVFDLSDRELFRNGEMEATSDEYLFVFIDGKMTKGKIRLCLLPESENRIRKLGEGLWGEQTFSAFWIGKEGYHGKIEISKSGNSDFFLKSPLRFFRLKPDPVRGFNAVEVRI